MLIRLKHTEMVVKIVGPIEGKRMPIQNHLQRALAERRFATDASEMGHAAIHVALAEMHEHAAASALNVRLAPRTLENLAHVCPLGATSAFDPLRTLGQAEMLRRWMIHHGLRHASLIALNIDEAVTDPTG